MTHRWKQTIEINENKAKELIEAQFPLKVNTIYLLDEGWDNVAYFVNDELIFRFPRREFGVICMENEITLLPFIAEHISFPFSNPKYIGHSSDSYPYDFAGYTKILGQPLCDATNALIDNSTFALTLANWLKELHAIPVIEKYASLIKGDQTWRLNVKQRLSRCEENLSRYESYFLQAGFKKQILLNIITRLKNLAFENAKKVFLHGDLYSRHIIVDPINLLPAGLIDWGDIHVGHPGIDLASGMIFTEDALKIFLNSYGNIDDETIHIMLFHSFCHMISFLPYAYEQNKENLKQWAVMTLTRAIDEIVLKFIF